MSVDELSLAYNLDGRKIRIRQYNITAGLANDPCNCPVARAIRSHLIKQYKDLKVVVHSENMPGDGKGYILIDGVEFILPPHMQRWVFLFDHRGHPAVGPVDFILELKN